MSDETKGPWDALTNLIPKDMREAAGAMIAFFIVMCAIIGVGRIPKFFDNLTESNSKQPCWTLTELHGEAIKFNQCTGAIEKISEQSTPSK